MERSIYFHPAFHLCTPDPSTSRGIGGVRIVFALTDGTRGVEWSLLTDWNLPAEDFALAAPECTHPSHQQGPPKQPGGTTAGPIIWHWPEPLFDNVPQPHGWDCAITGGKCWADIGYTIGDRAFDALAIGGGEGMWTFLAMCLNEEGERT